jgi:hypothetical protein
LSALIRPCAELRSTALHAFGRLCTPNFLGPDSSHESLIANFNLS